MLVLDNNVLSDYLDGREEARLFLQEYEREALAVPSIVVYEALMGSVHGYIDGTPATVRQAITTSMDVLEVTEATAAEAARLQEQLLERGVPLDQPDGLIAASAREHGGTFATAEKHFRHEEVRNVLNVAVYDPSYFDE